MNFDNFILVLLVSFSLNTLTAQKINQFDENNKRTGVWRKYYSNNTIRYEGEFLHGKEIGVFKFYRKSNSIFPSITKSYNSKNDSVKVNFFSDKGKLETSGFFINKIRVGKWEYYFTNGKLLSEEFYDKGKLNGFLINYYPNGKITEETYYKNNKKEGVSKKYSSDGILIEEINYQNDKPNGLAKYYELNGSLKERGVYKDGKRVGKWEYFLDGEITNDKDLLKKKKFKKNQQ